MRALITGATSGIGKEMAFYLHRHGWQLVLTGRNETMLQKMAKKFGPATKYIALDLAQPDAPTRLHAFCKGMKIDFLINNAGFGIFGAFSDMPLEKELELINVNIRALHILTKLFLRDFEQQGNGHILNVASIAGFLPGPMMSAYYASKSYVVRLSLALREELRRKHSNVTVSVLCPGPVDTNFNDRAGVSIAMHGADAKYVAQYGIEQALNGKPIILPTMMIKTAHFAAKLCPEQLQSTIVYHLQKRKGGR